MSTKLDDITAVATLRIKRRLDVNGDGKIDGADAEKIVKDAMDDAAIYASKKPLVAITWAFVAGVTLTLFLVSVFK